MAENRDERWEIRLRPSERDLVSRVLAAAGVSLNDWLVAHAAEELQHLAAHLTPAERCLLEDPDSATGSALRQLGRRANWRAIALMAGLVRRDERGEFQRTDAYAEAKRRLSIGVPGVRAVPQTVDELVRAVEAVTDENEVPA